ncbi:MAG: ABC transporter ATP-binding protein [Deltaproteobacteria bacterium]|nr:ABC transporter ATP-binding protein [Deltaproteobacteria bacterium]
MADREKNRLVQLIAGSWNALGDQKRSFFNFVMLFVLAYTTELLVPWAIGYTIGVFVQYGFTQEAYDKGLFGISLFLTFRLLNVLFHHIGRYMQYKVAFSAKFDELTRIFTLLLEYGLQWHVKTHSGDNLAKLQRSALAVNNVVGQYTWQVIDGFVKVLLASVALFALDLIVAINVILTSFFTIVVMIYVNRQMAIYLKHNYLFENRVNRVCVDFLTNISTVKTLAFERYARKRLIINKPEGERYARRISRLSELKWGAINLGYAGVTASSLLIYLYRRGASTEAFDVAQVYVLISYLDKIFAAISSFTSYFGGIVESYTAYEDATELSKGPRVQVLPSLRATQNGDWTRITLKQLSFSYIAGEKGLRNINLDVRHSGKIALIGLSGGGKSTLLKILSGAVPPRHYQLEIDNRKGTIDELSAMSLLIPQEPQIFSDTLMNNLLMGDEIEHEKLEFFMRLCRFDALVDKLPQRWDTDLAANGLNLSGGEKQRIAMARGLLRAHKKEILLLDEPTSSLDPKTESEIIIGTFQHFKHKTIIASCHRWSLLPLFDEVVRLEDGEVKERGYPEEFVRRSGHFFNSLKDFRGEATLERLKEASSYL